MKFLAYISALLFCGSTLLADALPDEAGLLAHLFAPDSQTNLTIKVERVSSARLANDLSNTNLFSNQEIKWLSEVRSKYKNLSTNSGPPGSTLVGLDKTNNYIVAHFTYANSTDHENLFFQINKDVSPRGSGYSTFKFLLSRVAEFRSAEGDGYDAMIGLPDEKGKEDLTIVQIRNNTPEGLFVNLYGDRCRTLIHLKNGKAIGRWLEWDLRDGGGVCDIQIKSPLDYFSYMTRQIIN